MKKKHLILTILLFISTFVAKATDLYVNETGAGGAYTTISAAITAAANGDRIIIEPKSGGASYSESLNITKSLQFLSSIEGGKYSIVGDITIAPSLVAEIVFIGLDVAGSVSATIDAPATARTKVKILFSNVYGNIDFNYANYDLTVANSLVQGSIYLCSGRIIGNVITSNSTAISLYDENSASAHLSDTLKIIGNRISSYENGINLSSTKLFYQIDNNYIYYKYKGINTTMWKTGSDGTGNEFINNTFKGQYVSSTGTTAISIEGKTSFALLTIYNNLLIPYGAATGFYEYGIYFASSTIGTNIVGYNTFSPGFDKIVNSIDYHIDEGGNLTQSFTIDNDTGQPISGTYMDLGHPDLRFSDHDLTRNDPGCYGGSYSAVNYFPTSDNNSNRIYLLNMPRSIYVGNPIEVEAEGFDK